MARISRNDGMKTMWMIEWQVESAKRCKTGPEGRQSTGHKTPPPFTQDIQERQAPLPHCILGSTVSGSMKTPKEGWPTLRIEGSKENDSQEPDRASD